MFALIEALTNMAKWVIKRLNRNQTGRTVYVGVSGGECGLTQPSPVAGVAQQMCFGFFVPVADLGEFSLI